jgi:hypothetical protein
MRNAGVNATPEEQRKQPQVPIPSQEQDYWTQFWQEWSVFCKSVKNTAMVLILVGLYWLLIGRED